MVQEFETGVEVKIPRLQKLFCVGEQKPYPIG